MNSKIVTLMIVTIAALGAPAFAGDKTGNGGDLCEDRIKNIRDDVSSWINAGGDANLVLPSGTTVDTYGRSMLGAAKSAAISCTTDEVSISGLSKTCKNFYDASNRLQILCNVDRFNKLSDDGQYVLIHHEYAGAARLEVNDEDGSHYSISNQISEFLTTQLVRKLAVKRSVLTSPSLDPGLIQKDTRMVTVNASDITCADHQGSGGYDISYSNYELGVANPFSDIAQNPTLQFRLNLCLVTSIPTAKDVPINRVRQTIFVEPARGTEESGKYRCVKETIQIDSTDQRNLMRLFNPGGSMRSTDQYAIGVPFYTTISLIPAGDHECDAQMSGSYNNDGDTVTCTGRRLVSPTSSEPFAHISLSSALCSFSGSPPVVPDPIRGFSHDQTFEFYQIDNSGKILTVACQPKSPGSGDLSFDCYYSK